MKKILYLCIAACVLSSCQKEDENDVRNPLPTIVAIKTVTVRQDDLVSKYKFDYDQQRRVTQIVRDAEEDIVMAFSYNGENQINKMIVTGDGPLVGTYQYNYDEDGRLNQYIYGDLVNQIVGYNAALDQYSTVAPNRVFSFFESMNFKRVDSRYFNYDLTMKGPLFNINSSYHLISLLGPADSNLYYVTMKRPLTFTGTTANPQQLDFVNTYSDNDYLMKSVFPGFIIDYSYTKID